MTQPANFSVPTSGPATPAAMAARMDDSFKALLDGHSGPSRPAYAQPNTFWNDTSLSGASPSIIRRMFYDGADDIEVFRINITDNRIENFINYRNTPVAEDVASASTCDISVSRNWYVRITGTTTITSLGTTNKNQYRRVRFAAGLTLTHNATSLILLTGANITTVADDHAEFLSDASGNWRMLSYTRADGSALFSVGGGAPPVRQTVLSGPFTSTGASDFGGSTGSTTVTMTGTLTLSAAGGFNTAGSVDRAGAVTNASWTGLSTNGTMFLYLDVAANGTCTTGSTTLAPINQQGGTPSITNGQHTFIISEMKMYVGNGSTTSQVYRVFVGQVTVSSSVVSAISWYTMRVNSEPNSIKAFVNFVGSTAAISSSFNISSVTRSATGSYTVNFKTPMQSDKYCVSLSSIVPTGTVATVPVGTPTSLAFNLVTYRTESGGSVDPASVQVIIAG